MNEMNISALQKIQNQIVLQSNDLGLSTLAAWVDDGVIDVAPDFQRRDRWDSEKQSLLIESFMMNLPIPPVYLAETETGEYSVIDGRQRLTAIHRFMRGDLELKGLSSLEALNGRRASELPPGILANLGMRPLRTVTLLHQTDPEAKYLVFHRLNSAGEVLNAQEIRNVAYRGTLNDLLHRLSQHDFLRTQLKISGPRSTAYRSMQDLEYVLRFIMLRENWQDFSGDMSQSLDRFMIDNQDADKKTLAEMENDFIRSIYYAERLFGPHAFHRPDGTGWRDQFLAGLYDAEMVAISMLDDATLEALDQEHALRMIRKLFQDQEYESAVRTATNTPSKLRRRIRDTRNMLAGV